MNVRQHFCAVLSKERYQELVSSPVVSTNMRTPENTWQQPKQTLFKPMQAHASTCKHLKARANAYKHMQASMCKHKATFKQVQANTMADEDQISDVDEMLEADQETDVDAASSVLSQSLRSTHSYNGGDSSRYYRYVLACLLMY